MKSSHVQPRNNQLLSIVLGFPFKYFLIKLVEGVQEANKIDLLFKCVFHSTYFEESIFRKEQSLVSK